MNEEYEEIRGERRSFYCPNKLWDEILKKTDDIYSISHFIKMAIEEKMKRDKL